MNSHAVGEDSVAFRRKFLSKSPKHLAVLDAAAGRVGGSEPAPEGLHRGVAVFMGYGSYVAAAAEISVDGDKTKLRLCARSRRLVNKLMVVGAHGARPFPSRWRRAASSAAIDEGLLAS